MIQLPVRRCPACGFTARTARFIGDGPDPGTPRPLVCPNCGREFGRFDPRLL